MKYSLLAPTAFAAALLAGLIAGPADAEATTQSPTAAVAPVTSDRRITLTTEFAPTYGAGVYAGSLQLHISHDGIVSGYYRPDQQGFEPVEGGLDGNKLWLDFGFHGRIHVTGTFDGSTIQASTFFDDQTWTFTGKSAG